MHGHDVIHVPVTDIALYCWPAVCGDSTRVSGSDGKDEGCMQVNRDANNAQFKISKKIQLCKCLMGKETHSSCLREIKDSHNAFGTDRLTVNMTPFS